MMNRLKLVKLHPAFVATILPLRRNCLCLSHDMWNQKIDFESRETHPTPSSAVAWTARRVISTQRAPPCTCVQSHFAQQ